MREADARAHSVAINPVGLLKTQATGEGLAWAEVDSAAAEEDAAAGSVAGAVVVVAAEVAEAAVAVVVAVAADDDASWAIGSPELFVIGTC